MKKLSLLALILFLIIGCEPCEDCGPTNNSPYFNLSIFNETYYLSLKVDSGQFETNLANIDTLIDELETAIENDSMDMEAVFQARIDSLLRKDTVYNDSLAIINNHISDVQDRLISIESINGINNVFRREDDESDSATSFRIPLNVGSTESAYEIKIRGIDAKRFLRVTYSLEDTVINNRVTKNAKNLQVIGETDFDSIRGPFGCEPIINCSSNQLNIYVEI